ncbi:nuclear pore complex protein Nup107 [Fopius arisanus]|uniref:Nuclear pore complex protein n=2 Tax=Fopius arisanus TaxID=64838 RepID=A0A9R1TW83_9HYME|nr:PREDICTED: nuclear pore complex protein Nup107 [Fopius arisanus]
MDSRSNSKEDLDASIALLNQENHQRKSLLRLTTKTTTPKRISLHQSVLTRKNPELLQNSSFSRDSLTSVKHDTSEVDLSVSLLPSELAKFSKLYNLPSQDSLDASTTLNRSNWSLQEMMDDSTATGIILKSDKPWRKANSKLFQEFLEIVQSHASELQIFDTIADFIQICSDTLDIMRGMQSKVNDAELSDEETSLENERNTWRLIYCLYQNRLASMNHQNEMDTDVNRNISEKDVITNLLKNEPQVREYQLIIDWLEKNAMDQAAMLPKIEYFTDKTVAWENTLHQLQNRQSSISFGSARPLVTSLDPDAPIREGKPLHDLDKEDDARLEKRMFIEVRCGRLQRAQELAIHCGQPWRAACLIGWQPHHDPNYQNPLTDTKLPIEGNPNRSLWKLNAWYLSQDTRFGAFYRGIYASLCGNLKQLLAVSRSWQDALWAHMKTLMDIEVESELQGIMAKNYAKLPEEYWKSRKTLEDVFDDLQASNDPSIRTEAMRPDHLIQKYLILDQIPKLMDVIEEWIDNTNCNPQFIRFLAHLVLLFRQIGKSCDDVVGNKVLLNYVKVLIEIGDPILIAFYTASLPQDEQISIYAGYLEGVREFEMRKKCLTAAEDANLNVEAITKLVVENVRNKNVDEGIDYELSARITEGDVEKIEALDWLTFYQSQRDEALWQANALIRYFLTCEKIDAARKAFNKIPPNSIEVVLMEHPSMETTVSQIVTTNEVLYKASASIREYLCYKAYLDAQEGFQEWFSHFHQGKPSPLETLPSFATFTEKVAHDHKKAQYEAEMDRWKCTMQHHTKAVKQLLFNVLLFPDGGWLVDKNPESLEQRPEHALRQHQLRKLRNLCIPKVTLLLLNVMSQMNEHGGCIELADTIASEQYKLYQIFSKERIREVYRKICESSVALMDQKKDPWGYPR